MQLDAKDLAQDLTLYIKVRRMRQWQWRVAVAVWLIRLAAWVMWIKADVEVQEIQCLTSM